jgi:hypothetical protein
MRYGQPLVMVRRTGRDASGDTLEPLENLINCRLERATGSTLPQPAPRQRPLAASPRAAPPLIPGVGRPGYERQNQQMSCQPRRTRPGHWHSDRQAPSQRLTHVTLRLRLVTVLRLLDGTVLTGA